MRFNSLQKIGRSSVVQEEQSLAHAPQGSGAKLIRAGLPLHNPIRQVRAHMVNGEIRIWLVGHVGHAGEG